MSERRPSTSQATPPSPRQVPTPPRPSPPTQSPRQSPPLASSASRTHSRTTSLSAQPPSSTSAHARRPSTSNPPPSAYTPSHSRAPSSSSYTTRPRTSSRASQLDPTQDVLTAGDGLASSLGVSPPKTTSHLAAAHARRLSSASASYELSGKTAEGRQGPADGLTGFDPAAGYQHSGSGGAFTASGGMQPVPMNAPALMYGGGAK